MNAKDKNTDKSSNDTIHNVSCRFEFREIPNRYVPSTGLYIGKVLVAEYYYDGITSRIDNKKKKVVSKLPTIKSYLGHYETDKECEEVCIKVAKTFLKQLEFNGN